MLRAAIGHLVEFCYPSHCALCDEEITNTWICDRCEGNLSQLESRGACDDCARPLATRGAPCPYCKGKGMRPFKKIVALGVFDEPLKELIHRMKYHKKWSLAEHLADRLLDHQRVKTVLSDADVIVPVPLHWWRHFTRGYNQSDVLARRLAAISGTPVERCVKKIRSIPSQTNIHHRTERMANVKGSFKLVRASMIKGKNIVVVDDVSTTGATLQAVGRELARGEPKSLQAIVISVADPRGRGFEAI